MQDVASTGIRDDRSSRVARVLVQALGLFAFYVAILIFFSIRTEQFLSVSNTINILSNVSVIGIVSIGQALTLISGGFDLSVGGTVPLGAVIYTQLINSGMEIVPAILLTVCAGGVVGVVNGVLITRVGINPLIATLGTMFALRGAAYIWTDGRSVITFGFEEFAFLGNGRVAGIPFSVLVLIATFLAVGAVLSWLRFGSNVYAIGGDRDASRLAGVPVRRVRIAVYLVSAIAATFAGMMLASVNGSADPISGTGIELVVIGSVILGGTALTGGRGGVTGTLLGVIFLGALANGMNLMGLPAYWQIFVQGVVLIAAVVLDRVVNRS